MSYDEVKREQCPKCGGDALKNNFQLRAGHHARVFVECAACGALVARYILHAYLDPNYSLTAALGRLRHVHNDESARHVMGAIGEHQERARIQFADVKARLNKDEEHEKIYEIIQREGIIEDG